MNIAVTAETTEIDGLVPDSFLNSAYLMIIDTDRNMITHLYKKNDPRNMDFANKILEHHCEAVITGPLEKAAFDVLADAGVTRYNGVGKTVQDAYELMARYKLEWITDCIGGSGIHKHSHEVHSANEE